MYFKQKIFKNVTSKQAALLLKLSFLTHIKLKNIIRFTQEIEDGYALKNTISDILLSSF